MPGRKTKLTPEISAQITDCLQAGLSIRATMQALGIPEINFYRWRKRCSHFDRVLSNCRNFSGQVMNLKLRQGLVLLAIQKGYCTKEDIQQSTGFKEWIVRSTLDSLLQAKLITCRHQSQSGAAHPFLYSLK